MSSGSGTPRRYGRGRPGHRTVTVEAEYPHLTLGGVMSKAFDAHDAKGGNAVRIGFSDGTLLSLAWERDKTPRIYVLDCGRSSQVSTRGGDGIVGDPAESVTVKGSIEWVMVNAELVRPLVEPPAAE